MDKIIMTNLDEEIYHLSRGRYDEYLQLLKERATQD